MTDLLSQVQPGRRYTCDWCGTVSDGTQLSCPACGAPVNVKAIVSDSGWTEMPGSKDMAKLQFGNSFCQVEGKYVPVADMDLAKGDSVYFAHHVLLWKDVQVQMGPLPLKGGWKRLMAGLPLVMLQAQGPGHIAFSRDAPGEMVALPLQPGRSVDVREHIFVVATNQITYDWFQTGIWYTTGSGDDKETHYPLGMFMDRFSAGQTPGLLMLHAAGNIFVRTLAPGQTILIRPNALLFKEPGVQMQLHIEKPRAAGSGGLMGALMSWGNRHLWLTLTGPGRVAVQSATEPIEDKGSSISNHSPATQQQW